MKPYPAYKDSGIAWLGDVPEGWEIARLKWVAKFHYGNSLSAQEREDGEVPVYGSNGIVDTHNCAITEAPCIIVGRKGSFGKVNFSEVPCYPIDTTFFIDSTATEHNLYWLRYVLPLLGLDEFSRDSAVPGLNREDAYANLIPLPSSTEQNAIVAYLDRKTAQLDALIDKKHRLIALLREKRTAVISHAVTKGLNPTAPMRDSGIEWLGEVPVGWEVINLRYLASIETGSRDTVDRVESGKYPFFVRSQTIERIDSYSYDGEAVLTAGDGVGVGKVFHYVNGKFDYHQRVYKFSDFHKVSGKFLLYYMKINLANEVLKLSAKSTVESVRLPMLQNFPVVLPDLEEQKAIAAYLDEKTAQIDKIIAHIEQEIDYLQEYRTALISAAVTGKIDVRQEEQA